MIKHETQLDSLRSALHELSCDGKQASAIEGVSQAIKAVAKAMAPVWPLADYVAVNPYKGFADKSFLQTRAHLKRFSDCETMMPVDYYQQRYADGEFDLQDLDAAIDELVADEVPGAECLGGKALRTALETGNLDAAFEKKKAMPEQQMFESLASSYDKTCKTAWSEAIHEEVGKHCAAYYDEGQSAWTNPWKGQSFFTAWKSTMKHDRRLEILGLHDTRCVVRCLPDDPSEAIAYVFDKLGVPQPLWDDYLLCLAFEVPGWTAWASYQTEWASEAKQDNNAMTALMAMRLAYDWALSEAFDFNVAWRLKLVDTLESNKAGTFNPSDLQHYALLKANEIGYRKRLLSQVQIDESKPEEQSPFGLPARASTLAQMVFCIDVRSERIRRQLEATGDEVETLGFAGFFGLPMEYASLGDNDATSHLPVLLKPQFRVHETVRQEGYVADQLSLEQVVGQRSLKRAARKAWKQFKGSAVSAYAFVEASGPLFGLKLLGKLMGVGQTSHAFQHDGISHDDHHCTGPSLGQLEAAGVTQAMQADMAANILTNMGLTKDFASLVVFCGHASQTENNPLQAGLDCGACGGHSGEPNARLAAMLLNQSHVREELKHRGIDVPATTHFLGAVHNTTTDAITFHDVDLVPESHTDDLAELKEIAQAASQQTQMERLPLLGAAGAAQVNPEQRSEDWSEVRPEWGLTGNAAFAVGPRSLTKSIDLNGRSFLHSYDYKQDPEGKVLEGILTAPMVVTNWINMQYYASTVDQKHFGSGTKTTHNVVGRFGVFAGNGGDLKTGLPWESIHDGQQYRHDPVRLLSVVAAPRAVIGEILSRHTNVEDLVANSWVNLVSLDEGSFYRFTAKRTWELVDLGQSEPQPQVEVAPVSQPQHWAEPSVANNVSVMSAKNEA